MTTEGKAYRLLGLIRAAILAESNDTSGQFQDGKGVTDVLETAEQLVGEMINEIEGMGRGKADA